ncbi:MAG: hypothetical protein E7J47_00830 [Clostridium perfringens]|nr:hypothetical protein [Clostridium perfringens]
MKKKLLVVIISAIMGLQLVGCGSSNDSSNKTTSDNKPAATTENKSKVVDDDSLVNEVSEVYLDIREEYLEVLQNKQMNEWNEEKADALKDLKEIKAMTPESDKNINQAIADIEQLIDKYQNSLDGKGADSTGIQNLEAQIKQLLFDK